MLDVGCWIVDVRCWIVVNEKRHPVNITGWGIPVEAASG
jgi:hypothetical protein